MFVMRHQHVLINVTVVMAVLMTLGGGGLFCTQHISVLFVSTRLRLPLHMYPLTWTVHAHKALWNLLSWLIEHHRY